MASVIRFTCYLIWLTTFEHSQSGFLFEDNEAVIRMIIKGRSPSLRHVSRSHRVDLGWLFERINLDSSIPIRYVRTTEQGDVDELWREGDEVFDLTILEVKRKFDFGAWDVGAMSFKERERVDTDGKSRNHDRHEALLVRAAADRSFEVRQTEN